MRDLWSGEGNFGKWAARVRFVFKQGLERLNILRTRRERLRKERLEDIAVVVDLIKSMQDSNLKTVESLAHSMAATAEASREQSKVLTTWLESFRTTEAPSSHTITEEDELRMWRERIGAEPVVANTPEDFLDLPEEFKIKWILQNSKDTDN